MKYKVRIHYEDTIEAKSANEAINQVFEELDSENNMSLTTVLCQYHTTVSPDISSSKQQKVKKECPQCWGMGGNCRTCGNKKLLTGNEKKKDERCWAQTNDTNWCKNKILKDGYCKKHQYLIEK